METNTALHLKRLVDPDDHPNNRKIKGAKRNTAGLISKANASIATPNNNEDLRCSVHPYMNKASDSSAKGKDANSVKKVP